MIKFTKVIVIALITACVLPLKSHARLTAAEAFASAPQSVFPLLDKNARLDMIDYFNSGSSTSSRNKLDGTSRIVNLTDDDAKIDMTDASSYQLSIIPAGNDSIISVISTVATPAHDSHITFYDRTWKKLPDGMFKAPEIKEWLTPDARKNPSMVTSMIPFMLAEYVYNPADKSLTLTNNLKEFMSPDTESMIAPYLLPSLVYVWDGKKFNLSK